MKYTKDDIGKIVTFKLKACMWNARTETRIIRDVIDGVIVVRYAGVSQFYLYDREIINVEKRPVFQKKPFRKIPYDIPIHEQVGC